MAVTSDQGRGPGAEDAALDAMLQTWARHDAGDSDAVARIVSHADAIATSRPQGLPTLRRWLPFAMGGSALAASLAAAMLIAPVSRDGPQGQASPPQVASVAAMGDAPMDSFALLYTPTPDEEQFL